MVYDKSPPDSVDRLQAFFLQIGIYGPALASEVSED